MAGTLQSMRSAADTAANALGVEVNYISRDEMPRDSNGVQQRYAKGYQRAGRIYVCIENHSSEEDVMMTVMHEAVGHKGLRALVGTQNMDRFCMAVFSAADKKVREAFDYAIDRQAIIDNIIGSGKVPNGVITDTIDGYNPDLQGYTYDPEKARQLLAESSYNGEEITLMCNTSLLKGEAIMLAMSEMLNAVGFNTNAQVVEVAVLSNVRKTGDFDVFAVAWMFAAADPGQFLTLRVMNDGHHTFYKNEELNDLIAQSNREMDPEKRAALVRECARIMDEEHAPYSAFAQLRITYAADKGIVGLEGLYDDWFTLKYVDFDPTQV